MEKIEQHHVLLLLVALLLLTRVDCASPVDNVPVYYELAQRDHRIVDAAESDILRQMNVRRRLGRRRMLSSSFAMPMNSGAYAGVGQYFTRFTVGTPAQSFVLAVDTGSELTWVGCKSTSTDSRRLFDPKRSKTFRPIGCATKLCKTLPFSLAACPTPNDTCSYDFRYQEDSVQGSFAWESATALLSDSQRRAKLPRIIIGCTSSTTGTSFGSYDGVFGLAYARSSFSVTATPSFGGKFSYCLVDHLSPKNASNYLVFGERHDPEAADLDYVELNVAKPPLDPFYTINVLGISVGDRVLKIPSSVWSSKAGGVVMDSGSSLTTLVEPAYKVVVSALNASLTHVPRIDMQPFEFCYNWTGLKVMKMPRLVIRLAKHGNKEGFVRFVPPVKSYLIDVADNVKCIGFLSTKWPGTSTFGNILQQNHLWEYDIQKGRLGLKQSSCVKRMS